MIRQPSTALSGDLTPVLTQTQALARPLKAAADLDPILDRIGNARCVLLGEATHGTAEFHLWRHRLTERLIREKNFSCIAFAADGPDVQRMNRYVCGLPNSGTDALEVVTGFYRWPTWTWSNREMFAFLDWLRSHNNGLPAERKVGLYGLDVFSLWGSMRAVLRHLERTQGDAAAARRAFECFAPYQEDLQQYAQATGWVPDSRRDDVVEMLCKLRAAVLVANDPRDASLHADLNAQAAQDAERYYRTQVGGGPAAWNVRAQHMADTLQRQMRHHGPQAKVIVWAHNTQVGDARFTDMAGPGMVNLGQLLRQSHNEQDVVLVGCATHNGTVVAASAWDAPTECVPLPVAAEGSWEDILHRVTPADKVFVFGPQAMTPELLAERGHRAVGMFYHPQHERYGNYVPSVLPRRYDALIYIDQTHGLHPLPVRTPAKDEPETLSASE